MAKRLIKLKINIPNLLVIFRIVLIPVFLFFYLSISPGDLMFRTIAFAIFVIAAVSDFFDGYLARKWKTVSAFGQLMDPLADKMLVSAAMIALASSQELAAWVVVLIICREFWVTALRLLALEQGRDVISASIWGKIKTVLQIVMIGSLLAGLGTSDFIFFFIPLPFDVLAVGAVISITLVYLALIATIFSAYEYTKNAKDVFLQ